MCVLVIFIGILLLYITIYFVIIIVNKKYKDSEIDNNKLKQRLLDEASHYEDQRRASTRTIQITNNELEK